MVGPGLLGPGPALGMPLNLGTKNHVAVQHGRLKHGHARALPGRSCDSFNQLAKKPLGDSSRLTQCVSWGWLLHSREWPKN